MRQSSGASVVAALCLSFVARPAFSDTPPSDSAIDVQTFEYAVGPKTFFTVSDADTAAKQQLAVDALLTFLSKPFSVYQYDPTTNMVGNERVAVVKSLTAAQLTAAYGLSDKLQIGANLPIVFALQGDGLDAPKGMPDPNGLSVTGLGDLVVEGKLRLYKQGALRLGGLAGISLPTSFGSNGSQFIGDDLPTVRSRFLAQYDIGSRVSVGANVGVILRKPRTIYGSTIGQQLTWGAAAAVRLTDRFSLVGEGYGRAGIPSFSLDASPLEVEGGLRLYATNAFAVVLGGGAGLVNGIGSPRARFFLSLGYSPDVRDSDGDGIPNGRDKCPLVAEDKDGYEDDDGCPDDDNDGDRRPDATDKCPSQAEDLDGFEDDDGCPELDNDKDGILDLQDKCPMDAEDGKEPFPKDGCPADKRDSDGDGINDALDKCPTEEEDVDGFEDADGCPELDNDKDGIPDAADKCPACPEDKDGFEDADGCPDLDNDKDGVADTKDRCPMEPETINGFQDDDGCPDTGGKVVVNLDGDRLMIDAVPTLAGNGNGLSPAGIKLVDQIALVMLGHDDVTKWLLALAQPNPDASRRLAAAVKARLVAKGIPAERFEVVGATGNPKIGGVVQERGEGAFTCPAGIAAVPRPEASKPPAPPDPEPDAPAPSP